MSGVPSTAVAFTMGSLSLCIPALSPSSLSFRRSRSSRVFASRDGPELDKWDQMELNFGRLLGEDPKLTLAKVMARKANPDVSYLDIEKSFQNKKGKLNDYMIKISEDMNVERQPSVSSNRTSLSNPKTPNIQRVGNLNLSRPIMKRMTKTTRQDEKFVLNEETNQVPSNTNKAETSNISLRKPSAVHVDESDDIELDKYSRLEIKPNLFLKMRKGSTEKVSDIPLLKKPEVMKMPSNPDLDLLATGDSVQSTSTNTRTPDNKVKLLNPSEASHDNFGVIDEVIEQNSLESVSADGTVDMRNDVRPSDYNSEWSVKPSLVDDVLDLGLQPPIKSGIERLEPRNDESSTMTMVQNIMSSGDAIFRKTSLVEKPQRVESYVKRVSDSTGIQTVNLAAEIDPFIPSEQEEHEATDWKRAERLLSTGERVEVELISYSGRGFIVSFGSLIGFLPYRNLGSKWKFLTFESWLRRKGLESLDPSIYGKNMIIMGSDVQHKNLSMDENNELSPKAEETFHVNTKFEDFLEAYDQEKTKFLSSFIGQKIWVSIVTADRISRRLLFSRRQKEKEEVAEKKRSLMVELSVGDVVKCCIKKITYFGIFVEIEGVPALIHQSEVSWDATLDPSSFFKIDQIVEAKVHQLDYARERITLSLRETMPDPLMETLESVVGDSTSSVGNLEADAEWADVESLIKELQQIDGVHNVSKGRFFLSPGLAPTFQVYMTSMFDNQYKLLARYGNKIQEVVVEASLDKERMKDAISTCTNRVA